MIKRMIAAIDVFRAGRMVADAAKAKKRAALVGTLSVLIYALAELGKEFGYDLGVSEEMAKHLAMFLGSVAGLFVTFATSDKVGLLPAKHEAPELHPAGPDQQLHPQDAEDLRGGP